MELFWDRIDLGEIRMRKVSLFCLALAVFVMMAACARSEGTGDTSAETIESESPDASAGTDQEQAQSEGTESGTKDEEEENPVSYLTGLACTAEEQQMRPLAVMLNNIKAGCPQAGIGQASVIYEAPMEKADVTRLMPLFENWQDMEYLGYIRSSRDYFVYCALEFDAIYAHFGQATPYVGAMLNSDQVDNISGAVAGIDRPASNETYPRSNKRKAPHNVYTTGALLLDQAERFEYSLTYHDTHKEKFTFAPLGERADYTGAPDASALYPGGKSSGKANGYANVQAYFEYNPQDNKYYRYQYGAEHIDERTGEQLAVDNVIFQYCHGEFRDENGYMSFMCHGGWEEGVDHGEDYKVQVFTGGKMIEGTWSRYADTDPALYVDENGDPIELNRGKTWICLIWNEHADDVVIE